MSDEAALFETLTTLQRTAARELAEVLSAEGSTVDQWRLLRGLADGSGHRVGELAAALVVPLPTMTRLVDTLASLGLLYRRPADDDRRSVELYLSRPGRQRLGRLDAVAQAPLSRLREHPAWSVLSGGITAAR